MTGPIGQQRRSGLLLGPPDPFDAGQNALRGQATPVNGLYYGGNSPLRVAGHEQHVGSGFHRQHRRLVGAVGVGNGPHYQGVGDNQAVKTQLLAQ
jgi:hypothetical protein